IAGWSTFSFLLLGCYLVAACVNTLILLVELAVSAFVIVIVKPLDAIRGRIPKKTLYGLGIFAYFIISIGLIFCGSYIDQPISYISENNRLAQRWEAVSEYQLLSSISIGQDAATFSGGSKELDQDLYDWYSSISDTKGYILFRQSITMLALSKYGRAIKPIPRHQTLRYGCLLCHPTILKI
uniref:hypothetical protein n=1 Tax=Agathobacter sp. TaxID=2021311 RepID=UPI0040572206